MPPCREIGESARGIEGALVNTGQARFSASGQTLVGVSGRGGREIPLG